MALRRACLPPHGVHGQPLQQYFTILAHGSVQGSMAMQQVFDTVFPFASVVTVKGAYMVRRP